MGELTYRELILAELQPIAERMSQCLRKNGYSGGFEMIVDERLVPVGEVVLATPAGDVTIRGDDDKDYCPLALASEKRVESYMRYG